ncbi:unnamed protein product [Adineta steineri]|uniref:ADP-ribosylhydrolase ARH3 n=1 Tax=Adineta steineri TaxID=433720 RepID=A0A819JIC2_9BILA|nr:unnamed protein product [Adineta steineri]CAF1429404.1 unnamed protein product [Adineta steineri]CAF1461417.1 unnamed protein product [Adineta steineri]CAF3529800.1 unnamed protein product [Adineta steineri]CAF3922596.1 unnamed protein product [Adineta steineri]
MSNEKDDNKPHITSSTHSEDISNHKLTTDNNELPKSRGSSASKKHQEQQSTSVNQHTNETRIKSPNISSQDTNQIHNHKQINEEQPSFNDHSHSSVHLNQPSNDGPMTENLHLSSSLDNQNQSNSDDEFLSNSQQQLTDSTNGGRKRKEKKPIVDELHPDHKIPTASETDKSDTDHPSCQFRADKKWLDPQFHENGTIKTPEELEKDMEDPPGKIDEEILNRIQGSIIGMALGDALGAHVEFRPHEYMVKYPVTDLGEGGTWGLKKGQFTDDTSMALCLANSLLARKDFVPYDQMVRYKWWHQLGYMSSTGKCFDIGAATSQSIYEFEERQKRFGKDNKLSDKLIDKLSDSKYLDEFDVYCSEDEVAGNGALMRLTPVPLFFYRNKYVAIEFSGRSGEITHGDAKARDACRYYGALIVAALRGYTKKQILARNFYSAHRHWFGEEPLHEEIQKIAEGSFKKAGGYADGIQGKGYIVKALEAALWAFWSDKDSFEKGALAAVNLGDDTDTTAAIYGQLAGAYYGYKKLPTHWLQHVYAHEFMKKLSKWIVYEGEQWERKNH